MQTEKRCTEHIWLLISLIQKRCSLCRRISVTGKFHDMFDCGFGWSKSLKTQLVQGFEIRLHLLPGRRLVEITPAEAFKAKWYYDSNTQVYLQFRSQWHEANWRAGSWCFHSIPARDKEHYLWSSSHRYSACCAFKAERKRKATSASEVCSLWSK